MQGKMTVELTVVPSNGAPTTTSHDVPMTATTVGAIVAELGLDLTNQTCYVNGLRSTRDTVVEPGAKLALRMTETPKGS
jgi:hypothetical protein